MEQFNMISGLPRSGSTLLCQILNMNPDFRATQTSPMAEMLKSQQAVFSHSASFKAVDRLEYYESFANAQRAFIEAYYKDSKVVFDKNRGWPLHMMMIDEIMDNGDTKVIWTYRNPKHCLASMENQHRKYPLMQFVDEQQTPMTTIDQRLNVWTADQSIMTSPIFALHDAIEMGYDDRILIVDYEDLCKDTQKTMDEIHAFLGVKNHNYSVNNFKDLKQTTMEHDNLYNYKYPHKIMEGKIEYKVPEEELPGRFTEAIDKRFNWLVSHCKETIAKRNKKPGRRKKELSNGVTK